MIDARNETLPTHIANWEHSQILPQNSRQQLAPLMEGGKSGFQRFTLPAWVEERDSGIHEKTDYELFPGFFRENSHGNGARARCLCYAVNLMSGIPDNPFTPGVGELPPVMGHRPEVETHLLRMLRKLRKGRAHAKFAILYGPRGNGKTVLLTWLENQAAGESITCASLMPENLQTDGALARALEAAAGHPAIVRKILQSLDFTISAGMAGVSAQLGVRDKETDPARQIARMTLLITLDEAHRVVPSQLARLMDAVQAAGKTSPVALVLAGTPGPEDTLRASGASYWSRAAQLAVGLLPPVEAKRAVAEPFRQAGISLTDKVATSLAAVADHYPYFLQLYGAVAWDAVTAAGTWHPGPEQMAVAKEIGHAKRRGYFSDRYEEFSDARALPLARAVALAFQEHDECLDDAQLNAVLDRTAAGGNLETPDAQRLLRAHGYIWRPQPGADWEPGISSLMDYMIAKTEPATLRLDREF